MKTTPEVRARAEALVRRMTTEEKLNIIVETSEAIERLGVPKYYHGNEALHGVVRPGKFTVFPQAIALGAMFDDGLLERIAEAISDEARAKYFHGEQEENGGPWVYSTAPYTVEPFDDALIDAWFDMLDRGGTPILDRIPDAVAAIVNEEISAFLAGVGTAEECAAKIQSRASIWLAEHQ